MPKQKQPQRRVSFDPLPSSTFNTKQEDDKPLAAPRIPIKPAIKHKRGKRQQNGFIDNRGFPDQSEEFDNILAEIHGGNILRKRLHPAQRYK